MRVMMVYSFHAKNFMSAGADKGARVEKTENGFVLEQPPVPGSPADEGYFTAILDDADARTDCAWFRGGWFDALTMLWYTVQACEAPAKPPHEEGKPSEGGSIYLPLQLAPGEERTVRLLACWYVPHSKIRIGDDAPKSDMQCSCASQCSPQAETYAAWYAERFHDIDQVCRYWRENYNRLREVSQTFSECFHDTTLPAEVVEAVAAHKTGHKPRQSCRGGRSIGGCSQGIQGMAGVVSE